MRWGKPLLRCCKGALVLGCRNAGIWQRQSADWVNWSAWESCLPMARAPQLAHQTQRRYNTTHHFVWIWVTPPNITKMHRDHIVVFWVFSKVYTALHVDFWNAYKACFHFLQTILSAVLAFDIQAYEWFATLVGIAWWLFKANNDVLCPSFSRPSLAAIF